MYRNFLKGGGKLKNKGKNKVVSEEIKEDLKEGLSENSENTEEADSGISLEDREAEKVKADTEKEKEEKYKKKIDELNDRLMRQMAEFDNFRKRSEKEKSQMFDFGAKGIIEKILPVVDNFERGLATLTEEEKETDAFAQGIDKVYKQLMAAFDEAGIKAIEAVGKEFNPELHNAVMHGEDENFGENIVSEEFQKGYTYRDSVVRHSMVKVVN